MCGGEEYTHKCECTPTAFGSQGKGLKHPLLSLSVMFLWSSTSCWILSLQYCSQQDSAILLSLLASAGVKFSGLGLAFKWVLRTLILKPHRKHQHRAISLAPIILSFWCYHKQGSFPDFSLQQPAISVKKYKWFLHIDLYAITALN